MSAYDTNYFSGRSKSSELTSDRCRAPSCHSRIHVRDVLTERGTVTLCRMCRKTYFEVSS